MFSSHKRLKQRTRPKKDLDRFDYLQALVTEFQETVDQNDKEQVLANLANFAYDPINYGYLRQLQVIDLFVDCIADDEDISGKIVEFGMSGLCNLTADPTNRDAVLESEDGVKWITRCLSSPNLETVLSALTTLMQLVLPKSRDQIMTPSFINCLSAFAASPDKRLSNLATVFLEDYCTEQERQKHSKGQGSFLHIPLPSNG